MKYAWQYRYIPARRCGNVRGFNLFAAFLGVVMLAISIGLSAFTFSKESATISEISTQITHESAESVADLIRQDAHNTVVESVRRGFQNFLAHNDLDPPADVWKGEEAFKEWFSEEFVRSDRLTRFLADYIAEELLLYQNIPLKGHTVRVVVNKQGLSEALAKGASVEFREDGTFVFVYDTSLLEAKDMAKLPTIVVDGSETVSVFPPGRWMIPIPLRILEAYRHARSFRERVRRNINEFKILFGSCDLDASPACGVYEWRMKPLPLYPQSAPKHIKVAASEVGTGTWTAYNLTSGACTDLALEVGDELNELPLPVELPDHVICSVYAETLLYGLLQKRLSQLVQGEDEFAVVRPESIQKFRTWRIFTQQAIGVSSLIGSSTFPPIQWLLDRVLAAIPGAQIIPLTPCKPSGYMYCAVPARLAYVYSWVDPDTNYSVTGEHAIFSFRQVFVDEFDDIYTRYKTRDEQVKHITPGGTETVDVNYDPEECEKRAKQWCADQIIKGYEQCVRLEIEARKEQLKDEWGWLGDIVAGIVDLGQKIMDICSNPVMQYTQVCYFSTAYNTLKTAGEQAYLSEWNTIQETGHALYVRYAQEYNKTQSEVAKQCMYMFSAFKDENALCMDTNKNFCNYFSWLENGVPGICPEKEHVAYSVFWFHPFEEFVATCTSNTMPDSPDQ